VSKNLATLFLPAASSHRTPLNQRQGTENNITANKLRNLGPSYPGVLMGWDSGSKERSKEKSRSYSIYSYRGWTLLMTTRIDRSYSLK